MSKPSAIYMPNDAFLVVLVLYSDGVRRALGLDPSNWVDRLAPLKDTGARPEFVRWAQSFTEFDEPDAVTAEIENRMTSCGPGSVSSSDQYGLRDWTLRALQSVNDEQVSHRTMQRRIRASLGLSMEKLSGLVRLDDLAWHVIRTIGESQVRWSSVADQLRFFDQSHLTREVVRVCGFPPSVMLKRVLTDECFWAYRCYLSNNRPCRNDFSLPFVS